MATFQDGEYDQVRLGHLSEDISELNSVLSTFKSKRNRSYVEKYMNQLRVEQTALEAKLAGAQNKANKGEEAAAEEDANEGYEPIPEGDEEDIVVIPSPTKKKESLAPPPSSGRWSIPTSYGWDQSDKFVTVYVSGLAGVGALPKENIQCSFQDATFDLTVVGLNGQDHRLCVTNLDKKVDVKGCKFKVKSDRVNVMLKKIKGEYGADHWTELKSKKTKAAKDRIEKDPTAGIMDLMKDMYNGGDDKMKETIGKAMMESQKNRANPDHRSPGGNWGATEGMGDGL